MIVSIIVVVNIIIAITSNTNIIVIFTIEIFFLF
jgi:hypothetical protein